MKITLRQGTNGAGDPTMYIAITDRPAYLKDCLVVDSVDKAVAKITKWLEKNYVCRVSAMDLDSGKIK